MENNREILYSILRQLFADGRSSSYTDRMDWYFRSNSSINMYNIHHTFKFLSKQVLGISIIQKDAET